MTKRRRHTNVHGRGGHEDKRIFQPHNERLRPINKGTDSDTNGIFIFIALLALAFIIAKIL